VLVDYLAFVVVAFVNKSLNGGSRCLKWCVLMLL